MEKLTKEMPGFLSAGKSVPLLLIPELIREIKLTTQKINTHKVHYYPIKNQFELKVEKKSFTLSTKS